MVPLFVGLKKKNGYHGFLFRVAGFNGSALCLKKIKTGSSSAPCMVRLLGLFRVAQRFRMFFFRVAGFNGSALRLLEGNNGIMYRSMVYGSIGLACFFFRVAGFNGSALCFFKKENGIMYNGFVFGLRDSMVF